MNIYMFPRERVLKLFPDFNEFMPSEWNEKSNISEELKTLMREAIANDCLFTVYNFMLCFNMQDNETQNGDWIMFVPDEESTEKQMETLPEWLSKEILQEAVLMYKDSKVDGVKYLTEKARPHKNNPLKWSCETLRRVVNIF